jgi:hypothetical protein
MLISEFDKQMPQLDMYLFVSVVVFGITFAIGLLHFSVFVVPCCVYSAKLFGDRTSYYSIGLLDKVFARVDIHILVASLVASDVAFQLSHDLDIYMRNSVTFRIEYLD